MNGRLKDAVDRFLSKKGKVAGTAEIAMKLGKHQATVERWIKNGVPSAHEAYELALACECTDQEALELGKECLSERAKETA